MPYNNITSRTDAAALIPEEVSREMMGKALEQSAVLSLFKTIPVGRNQTRLPVLSALPTAYFVTGDTGLKQTTEINWTNKFLNIEEIAAIMPVPDNVLADVEANIWADAMPLLTEAFGRALDAAVFFGTNAPGSWPTNIAAAATAAGNAVTANSVDTAGKFFGDIDNGYEKIEADGYEATGFVGATSVKSKLRRSRDSQGRKLDESRVAGNLTSIDGLPIVYPMRGLFPTASGSPSLFMGDWSQFVVGVRQDIGMKILTEAVIQDNTGAIIYNLAQQDMTAVRLTFRVGWQVANTINNDQPTEASRYPVARLDLP
ncbi:phage major capsid protein [Streptomyces sp. NPDC056242]|uniref:phage major capsid protein n=1 Tax=Streptomyces sp. NPDC056242 TaxID=3345760 RepID=UPI0035DF084A